MSVPKYLRQKRRGRSDQALAIIDGQRHYLGVYGSPESKRKYAELISAAQAAASNNDAPGHHVAEPPAAPPTICEVLAAHLPHVDEYYGRKSTEWYHYRQTMRGLRHLFGDTQAADFRSLRLMELRDYWIRQGWTRRYVNEHVARVKRIFKWAVSQEMVPPDVYSSLSSVDGLRVGKTKAPDNEPVAPVSDSVIAATLPHLPPMVAAMVRVQRLCGCRPKELCSIRKRDIDRTGDVWVCQLRKHKTAHHGKLRFIQFGPRAQEVLLPWLVCADDDRIFPMERTSYARAVARACERNGIDHWSPGRLRHNAATEAREQLGLEAAQLHLGHSRADVTQIYAETSKEKAAAVARQIG